MDFVHHAINNLLSAETQLNFIIDLFSTLFGNAHCDTDVTGHITLFIRYF